MTYSQDDQIGMVHPEELTQEQRAFWKRYAKKEKWKQLIPQLRLPVYNGQYDLSAFCGVQVKQIFIVTTAGKWGLYQGSIKDKYSSYHIADLIHGFGAQLSFDGIWSGPEYGTRMITTEKVTFYRFRHFQLWEHVPESIVCDSQQLPKRFVSIALAAFQGVIGLKI